MMKRLLPVFAFACLMAQQAAGAETPAATTKSQEGSAVYSLDFDAAKYTEETVVLGDKTIAYRAYKNIIYVQHPVDTTYQLLNVFVPAEYYDGKSIGNYTADTAPIFLKNDIGGYMPALPGDPQMVREDGNANPMPFALSKGYVVVSPGARGSASEVNGVFTGKAPAAIVDLKAAVRYLRHNDAVIPGTAEKIISDGTSAGGAMSALLGASGNDALYEPYLKALGAAETPDNIFATVAFCPITDLEHADMAYEWLYNRVNDDKDADGKPLYQFTDAQKALSAELKALYPAYFNSLGLKSVVDGTALTDANLEAYIKHFVIAAAQKAIDTKGTDMSGYAWMTISNGKVTDIDFNAYLSHVTRWQPIKDPPAFDWLGDQSTQEPRKFGSRENKVFGTETQDVSVYTDFSASKLGLTISQELKDRVYLMNAMNFIGKAGADNAPNWYIRHGSIDRDTAFPVPVSLYTKLMNVGTAKNVDFDLAWDRPHSGDYDLDELFAWLDNVCR